MITVADNNISNPLLHQQMRAKRIQKMISAQRFAIGVMTDGSLISSIPNYVYHSGKRSYIADSWHNIISAAVGDDFTIGLLPSGKLLATGENDMGQCNVSNWKNIVSIACGRNHTVGICADGKVVATGMNTDGQCNVSFISDAMQATASQWHTAILRKDGTVAVCGIQYPEIALWQNIASIACGCSHIVGLHKNGTVSIATESSNHFLDQMTKQIARWNDIIAIAAYDDSTLGLKADGTVVASGCCYERLSNELSTWHDIVAIDVGGSFNNEFAIGVKKDGSVIFAGKPTTDCFKHPRIDIYPPKYNLNQWKLFYDADNIDSEFKKRCTETRIRHDEEEKMNCEYMKQLLKKKQLLEEELSQTSRLFERKKRREIQEQIAVLEVKIDELKN